jgi:Ran GTPase-activating protein (RanGAP) involved in mRNA processing and transport
MNQISNLHILELGHTQIGDDGIEEFITNINSLHKLEKIVLLNNNFTDIGGNALLNVISKCRSLKIIEISGNQLSENLINKFNELERKNIVTLESDI